MTMGSLLQILKLSSVTGGSQANEEFFDATPLFDARW